MEWECILLFSVLMLSTFGVWYYLEKTLSIHSINTLKRESLYWLAILFTFALGTAVGDGLAEKLGIGYWQSFLVFGGMIAIVYGLYLLRVFGDVLAFWLTYILTRPLGASLGDFLSQDSDVGGLGLGPGITSAIFLTLIILAVAYLQFSKVDTPSEEDVAAAEKEVVMAHHNTETLVEVDTERG